MTQKNQKEVTIKYYALFREQSGKSEEKRKTVACTAQELYNELKSEFPFSLHSHQLRIAINNQFASLDQEIKDGDLLVFVPPVAGG